MKNYHFLLLFSLIAYNLSAQHLWLGAGINHVSVEADKSIQDQFDSRYSLLINATIALDLTDYLQVELATNYGGKGFNRKYSTSLPFQIDVVEELSITYVDIPIRMKLITKESNCRLFISAGPYLSIGLWGKSKLEGTQFGVKQSSSDTFFVRKTDYTKVDLGLSGGVGVDLKKFQIGFFHDYGFSDMGYTANNMSIELNHRVYRIILAAKIQDQ